MTFDWSTLWLWAATLHGDRESHNLRPSTSPTRLENSNSHKKLSHFVSRFSPGPKAEREVPGNPRHVDSVLLRVNSAIGRRCGHRLQEGVFSMLLKFVDSPSTVTCKGSSSVSHTIGRRCRHWPRRWLYISLKTAGAVTVLSGTSTKLVELNCQFGGSTV